MAATTSAAQERKRLRQKARCEMNRQLAASKRRAGLSARVAARTGPEFDALLAAIPPDTRDLTARFCGDPLPGRSALDRRQSA